MIHFDSPVESAFERFMVGHSFADSVVVLGVDLSLTSTGLAAVAYKSDGQVEVETDRIATKLKGHDRLEEIVVRVVRAGRASDLVVLEGLAFAAHDTFRAGAGLSWMVRHELWREQVPLALVPPTNRIQYALGKGVGGKDKVLAAVITRYQTLVSIDGNDVADAMVLAAMGARQIDRPLEQDLPARCVDALTRAQWPETLAAIR